MSADNDHLNEPVLHHARTDLTTLRQDLTIQEALDTIRSQGTGEKIVYFYVVDDDARLTGVLPTRRLLAAPLTAQLSEVMVRRVVALPHTATVLDACECFALHKFLAFPVVDEQRRVVGVVDVSVFTEEVFDIAAREQTDALFEALGFRVSQVRGVSPWRAFRFRFPWLLATIGSGALCAVLASGYQLTLGRYLVLAFLLTLVLGLGESVSAQSMTVTLQALRTRRPTWRWYFDALRREAGTALLIGAGAGLLVGLLVWGWRGEPRLAAVIGGSLMLALFVAGLVGLTIPTLVHWLKLDPKIAAGPVTLALADLLTLLIYLNGAALAL